ncbi:hypothetical protein [Roseovarius sp. SYSU LYC5161]|uniref:hypothetical protein n=1 Tax=Roseovarius halophilus (ex Wu et al. 2025) TaxID=3376060 RepID=UPI0039996261
MSCYDRRGPGAGRGRYRIEGSRAVAHRTRRPRSWWARQGRGATPDSSALSLQITTKKANAAALKDAWLAACSKAQRYYDFADLDLLQLAPIPALLNGGFGQAHRLSAADLRDALT